jgi:hypothetical protein
VEPVELDALHLDSIQFDSVPFGADFHRIEPLAVGDPSNITRAEVLAALDNWGKGLVSIADAKANNQDYVAVAINVINQAYNYDNGIVLFKPTVAAEIPFRTTFSGALSYFVGGNAAYPEDTGFALNPWKSVTFDIVGIVYGKSRAIVQTKTSLTQQDGSVVLAYFSMGFTSVSGELKIDLHHSSLPPAISRPITRDEVIDALNSWGAGLVSIADAKANNQDYVAVAIDAIKKAYNYDNGLVLFKPTVAADVPFRTTFAGALSYFVGGNPAYAEDTGFALNPWKSVSFEIIGIVYGANRAIVQTKTTLTQQDGSSVSPYFSMGFTRVGEDGALKIDLHHSSLPYAPDTSTISQADVVAALDAWGKGLVSIADAKANNQDYVATAINVINQAYNYDEGIVLFKPTVAAEIPFRTTFAGALSYFVGGNAAYPEDTGFALNPWKSVAFDIVGIVYDRNRAIVQTKTTLTQADGSSVTPYFSMGFKKTSTGDLKIDLHHSSLPYEPDSTTTKSNSNEDNDNDNEDITDRISVAAIVLSSVGIVVAILALAAFLFLSERFKYTPVPKDEPPAVRPSNKTNMEVATEV